MLRKISGVEIGNYSVKLALCSRNGLLRAQSAPLPDNIVKSGRIIAPVAAGEQLRALRRSLRGAPRAAALVLPPRLVVSRRVTLPAMTEQEIALNLPYEFRDFLKGQNSEYYYDYIVQETVKDSSGKPEKLKLFASAVPSRTIALYFSLFHSAGFRLKAAVPPEAALQNLIRGRTDLPQELAVADIGHTLTSVYFFCGGSFRAVKRIEAGSSLVDEAISYEKNMDVHIARNYKENDLEQVQTLETCRNAYSNLAVEIMKAINFYSYENRSGTLKDIYCIGGGSDLKPLLEVIRHTTEKTLHLASELVPCGSSDCFSAPDCVLAAGAAMQAVR